MKKIAEKVLVYLMLVVMLFEAAPVAAFAEELQSDDATIALDYSEPQKLDIILPEHMLASNEFTVSSVEDLGGLIDAVSQPVMMKKGLKKAQAVEAVDKKQQAESITGYAAFDIKLTEEAKRAKTYSVPVVFDTPIDMLGGGYASEDILIVNVSYALYHFLEDGSYIEVTDVEADWEENLLNGFSFTTDSFSEFLLQYTVDFVYIADGETYELSLAGGDCVTLGTLAAALGIVPGEQAQVFTRDVAEAEFSSPALAYVGQVEADTTVGAFKDALGLACEYSAELTAEDIAAINGRALSAGDWVLISLQPFTTPEILTLRMTNGRVYEISVSDAQIKKTVITESGEAYDITVTYEPAETGIPEDADLEVRELLDGAEDYAAYVAKTEEALGMEEGSAGYIRLFDIKIVNKDDPTIKYQPKEGTFVDVRIELADKDATKEAAESTRVVHFADENDAGSLVDAATDGQTVSFAADGFSVYAIVGESIIAYYISDSGVLYEVTVTFGKDAQIPEGAQLKITEFEEGSDEFIYALKSVIADKIAKNEEYDPFTFGFSALDISIVLLDENGNVKEEIEPAAPVHVDMKIKSLPGVDDLSEVLDSLEIQHHVEAAKGVVIETVYSGSTNASFDVETNNDVIQSGIVVDPNSVPEAQESDEEIEVSFTTELFSTYSINYNYNNKRIHYVDTNGNSLTPTMTPNFNARHQFLIYDIEGYEYDSTHIGSRTGTSIQPILRASSSSGLYYSNNIQYINGNNWSNLNNNDIYVVYKQKTAPTTGGTPQVDQTETWPDQENPARKPQFGKSSTNNGNGTNSISLSITAPEKPVEKSTPADVIVVFDVSGSMSDNMNGQTRLARAKTAVNTMANTLLNGQNSDVRMALISFSTTAREVQGFKYDYQTFRTAVTGLGADGGTNWEQALQMANQMSVRSDAATFVVFVTDGDPTFRVSRGNVSDSNLDLYTDGTYQYYRNNHVFGEGNDDSNDRNFDFAVEQVKAIAGANKNFYAIGISNDVTKVRNLTTQGGVDASHAFIASNSTAMENAFKSITESVKATLGFGNVEITDGITALTNAEMKVMQNVDPNSFKYYRYGGANNKYGNSYANKTEWTTRAADGCAAATYTESDGAVHWDMGETFQLEDGVTYVVEFSVWPSQAAYDLVADLNNGIRNYASLTEAEKAQIVELTAPTATTTGTYALKTNTNEVEATYQRTTKTGDTVTVSGTEEITANYQAGSLQNMGLTSDYITVKKEWNNGLDGRAVDEITLTVTKDGVPYLDDLTLNGDNEWTSGEHYISAGVITKTGNGSYSVRELGHEFTVTEPAQFSYYWDLTAAVYRPMVINGTLTMLIKTESPTGAEGTNYYVIAGNKYQVSEMHPQLVASNNRRSNLNLNKVVTANTQAVDKVPNPDDVFTYTITVTDPNGEDVWFSAQDAPEHPVLIESYSSNVTAEMRDGQPTGSYSVPSGAQFIIGIKAGWNVRFFNLPTGITYSIQETGMPDGYEFTSATTSAEVTNAEYAVGTPGTVSGNIVTGTINQPNNVFSTEYTNNWNPNNEIVIIKNDDEDAKLAGAQFTLFKQGDDGWTQIATFTSKADAGETLKVGRGLYKLEETAAPTGYAQTDTVYFQVETSGNTTTVALTNENGEVIDAEQLAATYPDATASGNTVTVKNWPMASVKATKVWENADGTDTPPADATVVFTLYADGEPKHAVTLNGQKDEEEVTGSTTWTIPENGAYESEAWTATFTNLPKYKTDKTTEIVYTIAETTPWPGYTLMAEGRVQNGGTITNKQIRVNLELHKEDVDNEPLSGAKFTLYSHYDINHPENNVVWKDEIISGSDGKADMGTFTVGTYYLVETQAPAGYISLSTPIEIKITNDGGELKVSYKKGSEDTCEVAAKDDHDVALYSASVTVINTPGVQLPSTGGPGTVLYTAAGLSLLLGASLWLMLRRRKEQQN